MKFVLPDQLPKGVAELGALRTQARREAAVFEAQYRAEHEFTWTDVARAEYLVAAINQLDAVNRSRIAHHEAGHAVVAALLGGQVETAEVYPAGVTDSDGRNGHCLHFADSAVEQSNHLVAAAGAAAEAVWEHGARAGTQHVDARLVGQTARLVGQTDGEFLRRWALTAGSAYSSPVSDALQMVRRCWPAIVSLAVQIDELGAISHEHVVKALGLSNDRARHPFEISNIRAGLRAIPGR